MKRPRRRRRRRLAFGLTATLACAAAGATGAWADLALSGPQLTDVLGGFDFVPAKSDLEPLLEQPPADLIALARGETSHQDPGVRVRAYRALRLYPSPDTERALETAVVEHARADAGVETVYLRAAMESLAVVAGPRGVKVIAARLTHVSRDIRTAAARALVVCNSLTALDALRTQLSAEKVSQVQIAISEAIRVLSRSGG